MNGVTDHAGAFLLCAGLAAVLAASGSESLAVIAGLGSLGLLSMALGVRRLKEGAE